MTFFQSISEKVVKIAKRSVVLSDSSSKQSISRTTSLVKVTKRETFQKYLETIWSLMRRKKELDSPSIDKGVRECLITNKPCVTLPFMTNADGGSISGSTYFVIVTTALLILLIVVLCFYCIKQYLKMKPLKSIPGPEDKALPILGNALDVKDSGGLGEFLTINHKKFGPIFKFTLGGERMISVDDSDILKQMKIIKMFRPDGGIDFLKGLIGVRSVGFLQGDVAKKRRAILHQIFTGQNLDRLIKSFVPCIDDYMNSWIKDGQDTSALKGKGQIVLDIQEEIRPLWMALNTMNIFGEEVDTEEVSLSFAEALKICLSLRYQLFPPFPYLSTIWYKKRSALNKVHQNIDTLIQNSMWKRCQEISRQQQQEQSSISKGDFVEDNLINGKDGEMKYEQPINQVNDLRKEGGDSSGSDLLSYLLTYLEDVQNKKNPKDKIDFTYRDLHDEMTTFLFANFENFTIVSNAMYHISKDPSLVSAIQEEIKTIFPGGITNNAEIVEIKQLQKLLKVRAAIKEALRVSSFGTLFRLVTENMKVNDDKNNSYSIPSLTTLVIPMFLVHTNPKFWGPNCKNFDIYNFMPKSEDDSSFAKSAANSAYSFMPFGFGQRMCLGHRFAIEVSCLVVAMICEKFSSIKTTNNHIEWKEASFNVLAKDGIHLQMTY